MRKVIIILIACLAFAHANAQENSNGESLLVGTTLNLRATANTAAVLKTGSNGLGFYPVVSTTTIKANSAYLPQDKQLLIDLSTMDAPLTNIRTTEIGKGKSSDGKCYDLSGRKTAKGHTPRGIYVTNNRKFVVKP